MGKDKEKRMKAKGLLSLVEGGLSNLKKDCERKGIQRRYPIKYKNSFPNTMQGYFDQLNNLKNIRNVQLTEEYLITPKVKKDKNQIYYSPNITYETSHPEKGKEFSCYNRLISPTEENKACLNSKSISDLINNIEQMLPKTYSSVKLEMKGSSEVKGNSSGEKDVNRKYEIMIDIVPSNNKGLIQKIIHFEEPVKYDMGENIEKEEEDNLNSVRELLRKKEDKLNPKALTLFPNYK